MAHRDRFNLCYGRDLLCSRIRMGFGGKKQIVTARFAMQNNQLFLILCSVATTTVQNADFNLLKWCA